VESTIFYLTYMAQRNNLYIISMITAFLAYVLARGQILFWRATVITHVPTAIPSHRNNYCCEWIWGGYSINDAILKRLFSLHFETQPNPTQLQLLAWRERYTIATTRLSGQSDLDPVFDLSRHLGNRDVHQNSRIYAGPYLFLCLPLLYDFLSNREHAKSSWKQ